MALRLKKISELAEQIKAATKKQAKIKTSSRKLRLTALESALETLAPTALVGDISQKANREAAIELLQAVTVLIEKFESQYDELVSVLTEAESSGADNALTLKQGIGQNRILQANRKLINISNEMRSIFHNIERRFLLFPAIKEAIDSITKSCLQIAIVEDALVVQAVENSKGVEFDLERQKRMLNGHEDYLIEIIGDLYPPPMDYYHHTLILLNDYKISLREAVLDIERAQV